MESGEFRVKIWCVRCADRVFYSAAWGGVTPPGNIKIIPLVVGASMARPQTVDKANGNIADFR